MPKISDRALEVGLYLPLGAYARAREGLSDLTPDKLQGVFDDLVGRGQERTQDLTKLARRGQERTKELTRRGQERTQEVTKLARRGQERTKELARRGQERTQDVTKLAHRQATKAGQATEARAARVQKTVTKTARKGSAAAAPITHKLPRVAAPTASKLPRVAAPKTAGELPIASYNSLTASEILTELRGLTQTELAKVYKFEKAKEDRATILDAIDTKLQVLPIATYDALTVDEIAARLASLSESELKTLHRYEADTKNRTTVLERIDSLL